MKIKKKLLHLRAVSCGFRSIVKRHNGCLGSNYREFNSSCFYLYIMQILGSVVAIVLLVSGVIVSLVYLISPKAPYGEKLSSY
jgi:hypothetical protein